MRRTAKPGEFRSNLHRGGKGRGVHLSTLYRRVAVRATKAMGLEIAGVDMLESKSGPKILEINSSPGLEGIERSTGVDVAGAFIDYAEKYAELHKRMTRKDLDDRILRVIHDERGVPRLARSGGRSPRRAAS